MPGKLFDTLTGGMNVAAKLKRVFGDSSLAGFPRIKKLSRLSKSILTLLATVRRHALLNGSHKGALPHVPQRKCLTTATALPRRRQRSDPLKGSTVCLCRGTLSAFAHGGNPQDRNASPPQLFHRVDARGQTLRRRQAQNKGVLPACTLP